MFPQLLLFHSLIIRSELTIGYNKIVKPKYTWVCCIYLCCVYVTYSYFAELAVQGNNNRHKKLFFKIFGG